MTWKQSATHTTVIPAKAGNQYAAASRFNHWRLWNTGSPAFAGMTTEYETAISRHELPEACLNFPALAS
jgi:hypothetical protein